MRIARSLAWALDSQSAFIRGRAMGGTRASWEQAIDQLVQISAARFTVLFFFVALGVRSAGQLVKAAWVSRAPGATIEEFATAFIVAAFVTWVLRQSVRRQRNAPAV